MSETTKTSKPAIEVVLEELYTLRESLDLQAVVEFDDEDETVGEILERAILAAHECKQLS